MGDQMLIRGVPGHVRSWIEAEREQRRMTLKEFVIATLQRASETNQPSLFDQLAQTPPKTPEAVPFKFIDLFAGIGGLRIGMERAGGRSVFSCEWDKHSQKTYAKWFGETPAGDIRKLNTADIPDHDVLAAGFPCQPFSIAG